MAYKTFTELERELAKEKARAEVDRDFRMRDAKRKQLAAKIRALKYRKAIELANKAKAAYSRGRAYVEAQQKAAARRSPTRRSPVRRSSVRTKTSSKRRPLRRSSSGYNMNSVYRSIGF